MAFDSLADFLDELQTRGELHRISAPVSSRFEIAAISRQSSLQEGSNPALIFDQVDGQSIPVVTNLFGTAARMRSALRIEKFEDLAQHIVELIAPEIPRGWLNALQLIPRVSQLMKLPPIETQTARCQQVVRVGRDINLGTLPVPFSWKGESGPVFTSALAHTFDPLTGARLISRVPAELKGTNTLLIHCHPSQPLWSAIRESQSRQETLPLAISLGSDPAISFAAELPLPRGTDPAAFAGFLRNKPMNLVSARSQKIQVPADAEFVMEGYFDPNEPWASGGPIAAPTGFYGPEETLPVMHVTTLTHCSNPIFPASIIGPPPQQDEWMGRGIEQLFLPIIRLFVRDVVQIHWPRSGLFRNLLFVSVRKTHPHHARQVMHALWGLQGIAQSKYIVVVDEDVDVTNEELVWYTVGVNTHPGRDTFLIEGPTGPYDHAAPVRFSGQKMGIDATVKDSHEGHPRDWPTRVEIPEETRERIFQRWPEFGLPERQKPGEST